MYVTSSLGRRTNLGLHETLVQGLRIKDESEYKKTLHKTQQNFDAILGLTQDDKTKANTNTRDLIPANIKLAARIRFLFTNILFHKYKYSKSCFHSFIFWHIRSNKFFLPSRHNLSMIFII